MQLAHPNNEEMRLWIQSCPDDSAAIAERYHRRRCSLDDCIADY